MKNPISIHRFLTLSALALALPMSTLAYARGHDQDGRGGNRCAGEAMHGRQGMPELRGIDLTASQVTQLTALRDEQRKLASGKMQALREQHDALHKLVMSDAYTPAAAAEITAKIAVAQNEMTTQRAEQANKVYKLLTPEQRLKMQQNELTGGGFMGRGHKR